MFAQILIGSLLNALIIADSGGAMLTCSDTIPTHGSVTVSHDKGAEYALDNCSGRTGVTARVAGGCRLSPVVTVAGSVSYNRTNESDHTGTAFIITDDLRPFDIVIDNPGDNTSETFNLSAAAGWRVARQVSVGAKMDYTAADRARTRDLRHANSYMNLDVSDGLSLDYGALTIAADATYRRTVESIAFSRVGTTDAVYTPLIDYGNGLGVSESYNGTGFTDDTRQPLLSEYAGVALQMIVRPADDIKVYASGRYAHRTGHYGRDSQYTILHDKFNGNCWNIMLAVQYGTSAIEARCSIDELMNYRTNYLSQLVDGVTYYRYYEPTKTAAKMRISGEVAYIGYFAPTDFGIYRWRVKAGSGFCRNRVASWLYPLSTETDCLLIRPFVSLRAAFPFRGKGKFVAEGAAAYQFAGGDFIPDYNMYTTEGFDFSAKLQYTLSPMKFLGCTPGFFVGAHTLHRYVDCGITISI